MTCTLTYPHSHQVTAVDPQHKASWSLWYTMENSTPTTWSYPPSLFTQTDRCLGHVR